MKQNLYKLTAVICTLFLTISCSEDDATGHSTMQPTSPTLSVDWGFENTETLVEEEKTYPFTVTLSEPQIVDVQVDLNQIGGDATEGEDFSFPHTITIPAGQTSASGEIAIHSDDLVEEAESVQIQIGSGLESNVSTINSQTITFNIGNLEEGELMASLSWEPTSLTTNNSGEAYTATELADLRLLVTDVPYTEIVNEADGAGFETITLDEETPDGEYYIVADFYDAMAIAPALNLELTFNQVGVINDQTFNFSNALDPSFICENNYVVLAKVTKTGDSFEIERIGRNNFESEQVAWEGVDVYDFYAPEGWPSHITTGIACEGTTISGLNAEWMLEVWGEEIQEEGTVYYTIDEAGEVTIEEQYIFTTLYDGALYDYTVTGTGTIDYSGETPVMHLEYKLFQDGFDVADYWNSAGGMDTPFFVADVTAEAETE